jgi:hypothetical protein
LDILGRRSQKLDLRTKPDLGKDPLADEAAINPITRTLRWLSFQYSAA